MILEIASRYNRTNVELKLSFDFHGEQGWKVIIVQM